MSPCAPAAFPVSVYVDARRPRTQANPSFQLLDAGKNKCISKKKKKERNHHRCHPQNFHRKEWRGNRSGCAKVSMACPDIRCSCSAARPGGENLTRTPNLAWPGLEGGRTKTTGTVTYAMLIELQASSSHSAAGPPMDPRRSGGPAPKRTSTGRKAQLNARTMHPGTNR